MSKIRAGASPAFQGIRKKLCCTEFGLHGAYGSHKSIELTSLSAFLSIPASPLTHSTESKTPVWQAPLSQAVWQSLRCVDNLIFLRCLLPSLEIVEASEAAKAELQETLLGSVVPGPSAPLGEIPF